MNRIAWVLSASPGKPLAEQRIRQRGRHAMGRLGARGQSSVTCHVLMKNLAVVDWSNILILPVSYVLLLVAWAV